MEIPDASTAQKSAESCEGERYGDSWRVGNSVAGMFGEEQGDG